MECPDCGAIWDARGTCEENFHSMLAREYEDAEAGAVHHLTVLCYYLQHPRLYAPEGLRYAQRLLAEFVEQGTPPPDVRQRIRRQVDSGQRAWKIAAKSGESAAYAHPVAWTLRVADAASGDGLYADRVHAWAQSVIEALRVSGNLEAAG